MLSLCVYTHLSKQIHIYIYISMCIYVFMLLCFHPAVPVQQVRASRESARFPKSCYVGLKVRVSDPSRT